MHTSIGCNAVLLRVSGDYEFYSVPGTFTISVRKPYWTRVSGVTG